ncbi:MULTISPECIES: chaperone modulator CbpM [unclassified Nonomuraea]|uniref:chaperone modulator CbpM n=1 Tax=Nonomuraea sp. NPDC003804 TaxID=3154547 RepID=UPI0033AE8FC2
MTYALVRRTAVEAEMDLDGFARVTGMHPELARRLVALDLIEARRDAAGRLWFPVSQVALAGRIQRLRACFGLNYAAVGLVVDLLEHIARLEAALRDQRTGG